MNFIFRNLGVWGSFFSPPMRSGWFSCSHAYISLTSFLSYVWGRLSYSDAVTSTSTPKRSLPKRAWQSAVSACVLWPIQLGKASFLLFSAAYPKAIFLYLSFLTVAESQQLFFFFPSFPSRLPPLSFLCCFALLFVLLPGVIIRLREEVKK